MAEMQKFLSSLGHAIEDPEEEIFLLFSQTMPSHDLGFVDQKATSLELTVAGRDLTVHQSPTILTSNRGAGTTGAVVWKITPLFADWISSDHTRTLQALICNNESTILELGCGISGIVAMTLAPKLDRYIVTDQEYVFKLLRTNLSINGPRPERDKRTKSKKEHPSKVDLIALDWESSIVSSLPQLSSVETDHIPCELSAVIACDCIYNETLIEPFVRTCAELCQLKKAKTPTLCIIAQQLRSDIVFEAWLLAFHKLFNVWKVPEEQLTAGLNNDSSFVIHIGILRDATV